MSPVPATPSPGVHGVSRHSTSSLRLEERGWVHVAYPSHVACTESIITSAQGLQRTFWLNLILCVGSFPVVFRIRRIRRFLGLPDPDLSSNKQKKIKTLISTVLWHLNNLLSLKTDVNVPTVSKKQKKLWKHFSVGILKGEKFFLAS